MTCTWNFRRHAGRTVAAVSLVAAMSGLALPRAGAANLPDLRAQAAALASRINTLGNQEAALGEQYDNARNILSATENRIAAARRIVAGADANAAKARTVLQSDAVTAYVTNGSSSLDGSGAPASVSGANASLLRAEYAQSLASDQSDSEDRYHLASVEAGTAESNLKAEEATQAKNVAAIATAADNARTTQGQLEQAEAQDQGQIATLVAQQQAAIQAAAQKAALARLAADRARAAAAAAAATPATVAPTVAPAPGTAPTGTPTTRGLGPTTGGQGPTTGGQGPTTATTAPTSGAGTTTGGAPTTPPTDPPTTAPPVSTTPVPPPSSSAAATAVAAAESRVGDPYVWGAAGPDSFDCSGLVMWAYAQAGISLPHFSGAQYADTTHIPMSDLEPGDLVFFADPGEHVAMYVGGGNVVQAPYTGADVQIVPLYSEFVLAGRVG
jgi:cell wall-associated NlpC family hydrolase